MTKERIATNMYLNFVFKQAFHISTLANKTFQQHYELAPQHYEPVLF